MYRSALAVALLLFGCADEPGHRAHEQTILAFGTIIDVEVHGDAAIAKPALDAVDRYLQRLHIDWYAFGEGELGRANAQLSRGKSAAVSPELAALIKRALELRSTSGGSFDPTVGEMVRLWGFANAQELRTHPPSAAQLAAWQDTATARDTIRIVEEQIVATGPVTLDLSAMAKGAALEGVAQLLRDHGVSNAVIDAGGDIKVLGTAGNRPWRIGIRHPRENRSLASVTLRAGEAIVSSGDYQRYFEFERERYTHVIDPRSGAPVSHSMAVTVIANDAAQADAAATALMVGGAPQFSELTAALDIDAALLITGGGEIVMTTAMSTRLEPPPGIAASGGAYKPQL